MPTPTPTPYPSRPWTPLTSSNLSACAYDPDTRQLWVRFHSGSTYRYDGLPAHLASGLAASSSPGSYFHTQIKPHYHGTRT